MRAISAPSLLFQTCSKLRNEAKSIGLVPTMGALHEGHLALVKESSKANDVTVVSIFVNPIQFNNAGDLSSYPRDLEADKKKLADLDVDVIFIPEEHALYPQSPATSISFGKLEQVLEGKFRPGHFSGVGIVVSKLLNLVQPHKAYFGLKDLQQFLLIRRMVHDLNYPVEIIGVPTVREVSGLAMSSRNLNLTENGRELAAQIYQGLILCKKGVEEEESIENILKAGRGYYQRIAGLEVEYLAIVDAETLQPPDDRSNSNELAICFAGYVEGVRLIDNLYLRLN